MGMLVDVKREQSPPPKIVQLVKDSDGVHRALPRPGEVNGVPKV